MLSLLGLILLTLYTLEITSFEKALIGLLFFILLCVDRPK